MVAVVIWHFMYQFAAEDEAATLNLTQLAVIDFLVLANAQVRCQMHLHVAAAPMCIPDRQLSRCEHGTAVGPGYF